MSENSNIEWTDHTFNPWEGCQGVSPGCDHCYAEARNRRFGGGVAGNWGPGAPRRHTSAGNWEKPFSWQRRAAEFSAEHGRRQRVFCASLGDWLDNAVPIEWLVDLLEVVRLTPDLDWQLLSKRIGIWRARTEAARNFARMQGRQDLARWIGEWLTGQPPANVWLGASIVNQEEADRDIPKLLAMPARVRFLSMEPLLGPVSFEGLFANPHDLRDGTNALEALDWVIVGGESGPKARPMHYDWASSLRDQCAAAGVPFLFKQWGEWLPWHQFSVVGIEDPPEQTRFTTLEFMGDHWRDVGYPAWMDVADGQVDDMKCVGRVGKEAAGRLLDGVEHNGFPT